MIPSILPVSNLVTMLRFREHVVPHSTSMGTCAIRALDADHGTHQLVAAVLAAEQCRVLAAGGAIGFHFYTLNRADLVLAICDILGVR